MASSEFGHRYATSQLQRRRSNLRSRVKQHYLARILDLVDGPTVDIGCGAGQLLEQLPAGSIGLEVNPELVEHHRARGLDVRLSDADPSHISLGDIAPGTVRCAVLSHVIEHFDDAAAVLRRLLADCASLGIERLVVVVPGWVGYGSDDTHKTFVTLDYLREHGLVDVEGYRMAQHSWFPGNAEAIGRLFIYHELMVVYERVAHGDAKRAPEGIAARPDVSRRAHFVQFAKFVVVGVMNTAFSYGIYAFLVWLGVHYTLANLTSLVIGIAFSFKTQGTLVFGNTDNRRIFRFILVWGLVFGVNVFLISRFIALGFSAYASGAMAIPFTVALSYVTQKFFVFRERRRDVR